jgi:hypothetical protein
MVWEFSNQRIMILMWVNGRITICMVVDASSSEVELFSSASLTATNHMV